MRLKVCKPKGITADALLRRRVGEPSWVVPGIIPTGLSILAGRPKTGKSWLSMGLGIAVSSGSQFLGKLPTNPGAVLYLAMEDNLRRLKSRLSTVLQGQPPSPALHFHLSWPTLNNGALDLLQGWLEDHKGVRLVIVDTLAKLRGGAKRAGDAYHSDYLVMAELKKLADRGNIGILCVHHLRKSGAGDPFDEFSGSAGLTGAADALLHLSRPRGTDEAVLRVTGRDLEEHELKISFNPGRGSFEVQGDAKEVFLSPERRAILALVQTVDKPVGPKQVAETLAMNYSSVRRSMATMLRQKALVRVQGGYIAPDTPVAPVATAAREAPANQAGAGPNETLPTVVLGARIIPFCRPSETEVTH